MRTLNEIVYSVLSGQQNPITISDLNTQKDLTSVPRMALGESILSLCSEKLISYRFVNGKMLLSADPKYGESVNPTQAHMSMMGSALGGLSGLAALLGGMQGNGNGGMDLSSMLAARNASIPESQSALLDQVSFAQGKKVTVDGITVGIPDGFHVKEKPDATHVLEFWSPDAEEPIDAQMHAYVGNVNGQGAFEQATDAVRQSAARSTVWKLASMSGTTDIPVCVGNKVKAYLALLGGNTFVILPEKKGIRQLRIDWALEGGNPPKDKVYQIIQNWMDTLELQYPSSDDISFSISADASGNEIQNYIDRIAAVAKFNSSVRQLLTEASEAETKLAETGKVAFTKILMYEREELQKYADQQDSYICEILENIQGISKKLSPEQMTELAASFLLFTVLSAFSVTLTKPSSNIGPYNSSTDIALGAGSDGGSVQLYCCPSHAEDVLKYFKDIRPAGKDAENYHAMISALENTLREFQKYNQEVEYQTEFKMEGSMLAAYLGSAKEVTLPDYIKSIGDYAFKSCHELECIVMNDHVTNLGFGVFEDCPNLRKMILSDSVEYIAGPLAGIDSLDEKCKFCISGYSGSYAEQFAKENEIKFQVLEEPQLDAVITMERNNFDLFQGLALPRPDGFQSSCQLDPEEKKIMERNENTAHLKYVSVPQENKMEQYKDVSFSISCVEDVREVNNALKIGKEIEQRLNGLDHVHEKFRTCTADQEKILIKFDMTREGEDNGIKWGIYTVLIFHDSSMHILQIFMNGDYTHRQQEFAVKKWASGIQQEKTYKKNHEQNQIDQEYALKKQKFEKDHALWEEKMNDYQKMMKDWEASSNKIHSEQREWVDSRIKSEKEQLIVTAKQEYDRTKTALEAEITKCEEESKSAERKLSELGFFKFSEKKRQNEVISSSTQKIAEAREKMSAAQQKLDAELRNAERNAEANRYGLMKEAEKRFCIPQKPAKPVEPVCPVKPEPKQEQHSIRSAQEYNQMLKDAIYDQMEENREYTVEEIQEEIPEVSGETNQKISALLRALRSEGKVEKMLIKGKPYYTRVW